MQADPILQSLLNFAAQAPMWLVWLVGGIVALCTWGKHPGVSALTLIAVAIHLLGTLLSMGFYAAVPRTTFFQDLAGNQVQLFYSAMNFVWSLVHGVADVLLLFAIFKWREGGDARAAGM